MLRTNLRQRFTDFDKFLPTSVNNNYQKLLFLGLGYWGDLIFWGWRNFRFLSDVSCFSFGNFSTWVGETLDRLGTLQFPVLSYTFVGGESNVPHLTCAKGV